MPVRTRCGVSNPTTEPSRTSSGSELSILLLNAYNIHLTDLISTGRRSYLAIRSICSIARSRIFHSRGSRDMPAQQTQPSHSPQQQHQQPQAYSNEQAQQPQATELSVILCTAGCEYRPLAHQQRTALTRQMTTLSGSGRHGAGFATDK
jgi:hypothetical protein